jgi:hypothetical protein
MIHGVCDFLARRRLTIIVGLVVIFGRANILEFRS